MQNITFFFFYPFLTNRKSNQKKREKKNEMREKEEDKCVEPGKCWPTSSFLFYNLADNDSRLPSFVCPKFFLKVFLIIY